MGRQAPRHHREPGRYAAAAVLCLAFGLGACTDMGRFQVSGYEKPPPTIKATRPAPETSATDREHQRILASYGGAYNDPKLQALITKAVDRLVAASDRPDFSYRVTILNSGAVNAFALPTGQLYVTRGLLALASDTSELSSVLSHEMAHVLAKHASIREEQAKRAALVNHVVGEMDGADANMQALALAKTKLTMANFSRAQEFEADAIGVALAAKANFDPYGAARFLSAMEHNAALKTSHMADPRSQDFLSSHPATPERVENAENSARQYAVSGARERERNAYLGAIDNLVYGEDPSEGFVRGRRFLHPKLGFTFVAPESYTLDNTAQAVVGVREGGAQALRFDVVRVPQEVALSTYLKSGWMENVDKEPVEDSSIGGYPAATATANSDQWHFRIYALRIGGDVYRFIFAAKDKTAEAEKSFREAVNSFRRLTLTEIQAARPLRIKIVSVKPGDTVESMSRRMQGVDRPLERFRILNGLDQHASLRQNDRVKIVVD